MLFAGLSACLPMRTIGLYFQKVLTSLLNLLFFWRRKTIYIFDEKFFYNKVLGVGSEKSVLTTFDRDTDYDKFNLIINGKSRPISAVNSKSNLYSLQKKLSENFLCNIPLPNCVCGYVNGKNYLDFLKEHCGNEYFLRLDIKNFFESIKDDKIRENLDEYIKIRNEIEKDKVLNDIIGIASLDGKLPQGAVTSPQISNIIFRRLDIRIRNYCRKFDVVYTRYADDMLFSSKNEQLHESFFYKMISKILKDHQLKINYKKIKKSKNKMILSGYVISEKIHLSRKKLKKINTLLYEFEIYKRKEHNIQNFFEFIEKISRENFKFSKSSDIKNKHSIIINYLAGYRSYLLLFSKQNYINKCYDYSKKIKKIENTLEILNSIKFE